MHIVPPPNNVVVLDTPTSLDLPADRVLEGAVGHLESVVLFGYEPDGTSWFASSTADKKEVLWMLEEAKRRLFEAVD
jgi:hypothetical protein